MGSPAILPLDRLVQVQVFVSPQAPAQPTFNQGLIVGTTAVIPGAQRVRQYLAQTFAAQMLTDGFNTSSPEYIAAQIYFSQSPPPEILWVGRQDLTSIAAIAPHAANEGSGYVVGDVLTVVQAGASGGQVTVATIGTGGAVTGVTIVDPDNSGTTGTGYAVANSLPTTGGSGTGAQMDISAVGDSPLGAVQAARLATSEWWGFAALAAVKADHIAIAAFAQTASPKCCYFYTTGDADALAGTAGNVFSTLKALNYNRAFGQYATTQTGAFPNNVYGAVAALGVAMGLNTGLANSFFTMMFKVETGISTEPLTVTQIGVIEGNNGNLYLEYGGSFDLLEQGRVANAQFLDEVLNLDMLASDIQFTVLDLLVANPSIPQTDAGQTRLIHAVNQACERALARGFIAGGVWQGVQILKLFAGQTIPNGYLAQSPPYASQSQADRQARKSMPIYLAIIEAGAVQSVLVGVYVQR